MVANRGILIEGQSYPAWEDPKDPDDVKDYKLDWSDPLNEDSDTIATSSWTLPAASGLTEDSSSETTTTTTIWLSGGNVGNWEITNRITTAGGRTYDKTRVLVIKEL